jgi:hypothetical protein
MIISDLQYIESANETEVQGGWSYYVPKYKAPYNYAQADAAAEAFGKNTNAKTYTNTLVVSGEFSGAKSSAVSESF